jgi:hypothetical protein
LEPGNGGIGQGITLHHHPPGQCQFSLTEKVGELFRFSDVANVIARDAAGAFYEQNRIPVGLDKNIAVKNKTEQVELVY